MGDSMDDEFALFEKELAAAEQASGNESAPPSSASSSAPALTPPARPACKKSSFARTVAPSQPSTPPPSKTPPPSALPPSKTPPSAPPPHVPPPISTASASTTPIAPSPVPVSAPPSLPPPWQQQQQASFPHPFNSPSFSFVPPPFQNQQQHYPPPPASSLGPQGMYYPMTMPPPSASYQQYAPSPYQPYQVPSNETEPQMFADALEGVKRALAAEAGEEAGPEEPPKKKVHYRTAAGEKWKDDSLADWPENDHRIFVGNLGNEANDDVLTKAFIKYPSFSKAKVVRDKRTNKTKGFGFVSFLDPMDFARAIREMDGKYIGNRPVKLRKSDWDKREDEKAKTGKRAQIHASKNRRHTPHFSR